jgi:thymidylate synthase (FAD)
MNKIQVQILNPDSIEEAERTMVYAARLTQRGHKISCMQDLIKLTEASYTDELVETLSNLPHPTLQKFGVINIGIVGASRRFLAQITRHQNEVKFMSASLQYSDYSGKAQFVVPYEITACDKENGNNFFTEQYLASCLHSLGDYEEAIKFGLNNDTAGYMMPQGLRNVLIISATPFQWRHMISQRVCNRNTTETQYVMLRCWEELADRSLMFANCGPSCVTERRCKEGGMSCKHFLDSVAVRDLMENKLCTLPSAILDVNFPLIRGGREP